MVLNVWETDCFCSFTSFLGQIQGWRERQTLHHRVRGRWRASADVSLNFLLFEFKSPQILWETEAFALHAYPSNPVKRERGGGETHPISLSPPSKSPWLRRMCGILWVGLLTPEEGGEGKLIPRGGGVRRRGMGYCVGKGVLGCVEDEIWRRGKHRGFLRLIERRRGKEGLGVSKFERDKK